LFPFAPDHSLHECLHSEQKSAELVALGRRDKGTTGLSFRISVFYRVAATNNFRPVQKICTPAGEIFYRFKRSARLHKRFSAGLKRPAHPQERFSIVLKDLHACTKDFPLD
jgi:hypothetical protein